MFKLKISSPFQLQAFMYGWLTFYHQGHEVAKGSFFSVDQSKKCSPSPSTITNSFLSLLTLLIQKRFLRPHSNRIFCPLPTMKNRFAPLTTYTSYPIFQWWGSASGSVSHNSIRILPLSSKNSKKTVDFCCFVTSL